MEKLFQRIFGSKHLQQVEIADEETKVLIEDECDHEPDSQQKKAPSRTRNRTLTLRYTDAEMDEINVQIEKSNMAKNEFVLHCIRGKRVIVIDDLVAVKAEIHRQGVNINQMARAHNEYAVALATYGIRIQNEVREYRELNGRLEAMAEELQRIEDCLASIQAQLDKEGD